MPKNGNPAYLNAPQKSYFTAKTHGSKELFSLFNYDAVS
jgi:hypothetical protein